MIKFFRTIRQRMITESRVSKYLIYAFGEIVLVVIGILIALQLNSWNAERTDQLTINKYYERIHSELRTSMDKIDGHLERLELILTQNERTLKVIASGNRDSIPTMEKTMGALATMWTLSLQFPVTEEFLNQDHLFKIDNDSIKTGMINFKHVQKHIQDQNEYISAQYTNTIEPFFNKHINYSAVAMEQYRLNLVTGGPPNDYEALAKSLEFWNILTFKLESLTYEIIMLERAKAKLEWLDDQIVSELEKKKID